MVSSTQETLAAGDPLAHVTRPARALLGWMTENEGTLCLAKRQIQHATKPEYIQQVRSAIEAVQKRGEGLNQENLLSDIPNEIEDYVREFTAQDSFKIFAQEGWQVKVADLSRVCALQPIVFSDHAEERTESAIDKDTLSVAKVTLPISGKTPIPIQFDQIRNTWMITSRNPNLRIIGHASLQVEGKTLCGFAVDITPSFVQVAFHRGRFVLRDGYHRSIGLLARGIHNAPVLFREFSQYDDLGMGHGMLQGHAYLGNRPALLKDYLDEEVSAKVFMPASQKMIVVQGMEMSPLG